ncbi:DUF2066 domain-containing protein [Amphritea atlantica]|uniref:DUF2066 domain-containing protein n=1 Tax=Amphritea atlantica TaxID=355243 RepID=A0ABY5GXN3_9GAMM|nr:DUF2066 domain-containing protein [Amphritea atlantica]
MIRNLCSCLLVLVFTGLGSLTQAATVNGLYTAELLVPEQHSQPSGEQLQAGLKTVLIKVSGRSAVVNKSAVVSALRQPAGWLSQFSYQATRTPVSAGDGREVLGQRLVLEFDPVMVDQLLQKSGMKAIGHARPVTLVWLVQQRGTAPRDFVPQGGQIYQELLKQADLRGLPLSVPLLDLNDQNAVDVSDVWGFFRESILQASERYQPDGVLIGRLIQGTGGGWQSEWLLLKDGQARSITPSGALSEQIQQVINESADFTLASLGASSFNYVETGLQLEVANIVDIEDYLQLMDYLRQLPPVDAVRISGVDADRVLFRVELQGGIRTLEQAVRLNPRMMPTSRLSTNGAAAVYTYRWQQQ